MEELAVKVIPFNLATAFMSPALFAFTLILLGSKAHALIRTIAFLIGCSIIILPVILMGVAVGHPTTISSSPSLISSSIDLFLGLVFLFLASKAFLSKGIAGKTFAHQENTNFFKWVMIGVLGELTNIDVLIVSFSAAEDVAEAAVNIADKAILLAINWFFAVSPLLIPLLIYLFLPNFALKVLPKLNQLVLKYSRWIVTILLGGFGLILVRRGLEFFI